MSYDPATGQLLLIGYLTHSKVQTWTWSGTHWIRLAPATSPSAAGSIAYDARTRQEIMFGGVLADATSSQTWSWSGTNWKRLSPSSVPPARGQGGLAFDPQLAALVLYGGTDFDATSPALVHLTDTWVWAGGNWRRILSAHHPTVSSLFMMDFDPESGHLVVFGGMSATLSDQMWRFLPTSGPMTRLRWPTVGARGPATSGLT
jgi:hypothetical protein